MAYNAVLSPRHSVEHGSNDTYRYYFGYTPETWPCKSDKLNCIYLDAVYYMQRHTTLYSLIMWAIFAATFAIIVVDRCLRDGPIGKTLKTFSRRNLLQESPGRWLFGRVTRLQVTILAVLCGYLFVFTWIGIWYQSLVTPIKKYPGSVNHRTGLGGWSNRAGVFAYALTPATVLLANRESLLSLATGIPYASFNFLHRWTGRVIFIQASVHTVGWTIVEARLYGTPHNFRNTLASQYIIFGVVAQACITFLWLFSTQWAIKKTGHEFFKKSHALVSILYIGACWGHWDMLWCWCVAALALVVLDYGARWIRTALLHSGYGTNRTLFKFKSATANIEHIGDEENSCVRVDFDFEHSAWKPGQHFFLCFPALSIWQAHPFTPCSVPNPRSKVQHHSYLIRAHSGITGRLAKMAKDNGGTFETSVVITGPYGESSLQSEQHNSLFLAGGTGVTSVFPTFVHEHTAEHVVDFTWIVRKSQDLLWLAPELAQIKSTLSKEQKAATRIRVFVTREAKPPVSPAASSGVSISSSSANDNEKKDMIERVRQLSSTSVLEDLLAPASHFEISYLGGARPSISALVDEFEERATLSERSVKVLSAGPKTMGTELRRVVALKNKAGEVWGGRDAAIWEMEWDNRS